MPIFGLMTQKEVQAAVDAAVKAAVADEFPRWMLETADAEKFNLPDPSVYGAQADLYRKLSWVLTACEIPAQFAAITQFNVKRIIANEEARDIPNHPFEMLLDHPNPLDSRFEFLLASFISYKMTGNIYWWLNKENENAPPDEMWFIPSHMIQPIPDKEMFVRGYYYYPGNGSELILEPHEVMHVKRFNPFSRFVGLSAIESIAMTARGDLFMQNWSINFFGQNNGRLPSVMTFSDMIEQGVWDKIKEDTREASQKREMLMLRGVGQGGVDWKQNAISQKEMEFLESRRFNREEIWNTLSPGLFSMLSENATEANSRTGMSAFESLTVYPIHTMLSEKITNHILPLYGGRKLLGEFDDVRSEDKELKLKEIDSYSQTHTLEEIRKEFYGDEPLGDDRDKLLPVQINTQSGGIQQPPPQPAPFGTEQDRRAEQAEQDAQKAILELDAWQRKAVKRGVDKTFDAEFIPPIVVGYVNQFLPYCKSNNAIKSVFEQARQRLRQNGKAPNDAALVLEGLKTTLEGLRK